jgi:hypothetical protein
MNMDFNKLTNQIKDLRKASGGRSRLAVNRAPAAGSGSAVVACGAGRPAAAAAGSPQLQ